MAYEFSSDIKLGNNKERKERRKDIQPTEIDLLCLKLIA